MVQARAVKVSRQKFEALIVPILAPDPNPPIPAVGYRSIYPYPRLQRFGKEPIRQDFEVITLENEAVQVQVLPESGGRIWKTLNRRTGIPLFHTPEQVGLINFGLRGAWFTGGVEFNFPNSHSVTTTSPVLSLTRRYQKGGKAVLIGNLDLVSRMTWCVGIRLEPESSNLYFDILLYNRTALPRRYWWWMNAGIPVGESLEYVNGTTEVLPHFIGRREIVPEPIGWPQNDGQNMKWYSSYNEPTSLFHLAGDDRWFGFYHHQQDQGVIRIGCSADAPGLKFWNSGQSDEGYLWGRIMTCGENYSNTELQSGRPETQTDYGCMPPHYVLRWTEIWRPVWGLGGVTCASEVVSIHLSSNQDSTGLALLSDRPYPGCTIQVISDETHSYPLDLRSDCPVHLELPWIPENQAVQIKVVSATGNTLLNYSRPGDLRRRSIIADVLQVRSGVKKAPGEMSVEELSLEAIHLERKNFSGPALKLAELALTKDAGHIATHEMLAIHDLSQGRYTQAVEHCKKILWRNPQHEGAHYYLALGYWMAGDKAQAEIEFERAAGHGFQIQAPAWFHLSQLRMGRGEWEEALLALEKCLAHENNHIRAMALQSACLRHSGRFREAQVKLSLALRLAPLDPLVRAEAGWSENGDWQAIPATKANGDETIDLRPRDDRLQECLEVSCDYLGCGLYSDALHFLQTVLEEIELYKPDSTANPMVYYYLGYLCEFNGHGEQAKEWWAQAAKQDSSFVFPFRHEDAQVLGAVLKANPQDGLAHGLLGMLETYWQNPGRALPHLEQAAELCSCWDQPRRLLAMCLERLGKLEPAIEKLWQAIRINPDNPQLYVELDELLAGQNSKKKLRQQLWKSTPASILQHDPARGRCVETMISNGELEQALRLLNEHVFFPEEGSAYYRDLFVQIQLLQALNRLEEGNFSKAYEHAIQANTYPENLGLARPFITTDSPALVLQAIILTKLGNESEARKTLLQAANERHREINEAEFFSGMALDSLGRKEEASIKYQNVAHTIERGLAWPDYDQQFAWYLKVLYEARKAQDAIGLIQQAATSLQRYAQHASIYARILNDARQLAL